MCVSLLSVWQDNPRAKAPAAWAPRPGPAAAGQPRVGLPRLLTAEASSDPPKCQRRAPQAEEGHLDFQRWEQHPVIWICRGPFPTTCYVSGAEAYPSSSVSSPTGRPNCRLSHQLTVPAVWQTYLKHCQSPARPPDARLRGCEEHRLDSTSRAWLP